MAKQHLTQWHKYGTWWRKLKLNRRYKDVLFRKLFHNKQDLLDLYNALNGSTYTDPDELEVITMEDVVFMKMKNDLSFIIGNSLNLYEHQSTWNPNMPLRGLFYFAQQFEGLLGSHREEIYGKRLVELPTPAYIVFYNGSDMNTDNIMLYLSDSYATGRGSGCLECTCEVLNINRGYNAPLMNKCHRLWEYSEFSSEIEENIRNGMNRKAAIETAIETCIEKDILTDILLTEKAEVTHMILTEYNEKRHLKYTFMEGREEGLEEGLEKGQDLKLQMQIQKKLSKGKTIPEIAEELEEEVSVIEEIVSRLQTEPQPPKQSKKFPRTFQKK